MQNLSFRYTRWINQRKKRVGHLFQGRYKAILVDADSYLLQLVCYIHLNPVRANMVKRPEHYRWSGHRAYIGREDFHRGAGDTRILGEDKFLNRVLAKADRPAARKPASIGAIMRQVARHYRTSEKELCAQSRRRELAEARGVVAWLAVEQGGVTLREVAAHLNRDPSAISYALRRISEKARQSRAFQKRLQRWVQ